MLAESGLSAAMMGTANDQPVLRTGQRDIEQASVLCQRPSRGIGAQACHLRIGVFALPAGQNGRGIRPAQQAAIALAGWSCRIGQDHDRRLQPFRAVDRHHPHFGLRACQIALDVSAVCVLLEEEALQARRIVSVMAERGIDQFFQRIDDRSSEPRDQPVAGVRAIAEFMLQGAAQKLMCRQMAVRDEVR